MIAADVRRCRYGQPRAGMRVRPNIRAGKGASQDESAERQEQL